MATPLSVTASSPSPSPFPSLSPSPSPLGRRRWREGEADAAAAVLGARGASFIPPPDLPLLHSSARAPEEEAAGHGGLHRREAPFPGRGPSPGPLPGSGSPASPMELLPTQGQTLRHYTASRPRPRRTHTQPPSSRPQEPVSENEASETMGRVDEGVEEFFTKKIIPDYALKGRWEESNPAQATPSESSSTPSALTPFSSSSDNITSSATTVTSSSVPSSNTSFTSTNVTFPASSVTPPGSSSITSSTTTTTTTAPPSKNIKKKFGDFFAFKRARAGRAAKAGGGEGGGGEGVKVKRTSIADLIRPLREAKEREREREREREKEREKERGTRSVEDVNVSNDAAITEGTAAAGHHLPGDQRDKMAPATTVTTTAPSSEATPLSPTTTTPDLTTVTLTNQEEGVHVPSLPVWHGHASSPVATAPVIMASTEQERSSILEKEMNKGGGTPHGERRLKVTKRSLREGKSQSLILLTGLEPEDKDNAHSKKHASESTFGFEQRLQVMLQRMGVAKTPPADTKTSQNKEEELRKANSEGAILDKPEPPPTFMKPRTMSTSSDTRRPMQRVLDPLHPDLPFHPKPVVPERPVGPLPPKPAIAAKPPLPALATPAGGAVAGRPVQPHLPSSAPPSTSSSGGVQPRLPSHEGKAQNEIQDDAQGAASAPSPRKEAPPPAPSPRRGLSTQDRSEKAQSVTDESLPKPHPRMKPLPQRRAVSVHEDTLAMTQELKAVLQRSPIRLRGNRGDLPTCTEDPPTREEAPEGDDRGKKAKEKGEEEEVVEEKEKVKMDEMKAEKGRTRGGEMAANSNKPTPGEGETRGLVAPTSASTTPAHGEPSPPPSLTPGPALEKAPPAPTQAVEKPPVAPLSREKASSTTPALSKTSEKSPPCQETTLSTTQPLPQTLRKPPATTPSQEKSPSTTPATADLGNSTEEREETVSKQHTAKAEPPDQRTEPRPL